MNDRMKEIIAEVDTYIEGYSEGDLDYRLMLTSIEKSKLESYLNDTSKSKHFRIINGIFKPGFLERPYYIRHI